jgi:CelD/BcsL family acetyltransferase involved in cellulose biosynthesis
MTYTAAFEPFDSVHDDWLALLSPLRARNVFQHPRWQQVWLDVFDRRAGARFLAVRENGALVGLASLLVDADTVSFLGDHNICDYMDFVLSPGKEEPILSAMLDALLDDGLRQFTFWGLREDSPSLALLPELAHRRSLDVQIEDEAVCPSLDLPPTWDDYLQLLGKKNRHELRRKLRRLDQLGPTNLRVLCSPQEVEQGMNEFLRLMTLKSDKAQFMTPEMERFFRAISAAIAEEGLGGLYMFEVEGRVVASIFCFEDPTETLIYNSGYDPQSAYLSVGLLSKAACLRHAIEDGRKRLDFLRGSEPYKYDLGGRDLHVKRCLINKPSVT